MANSIFMEEVRERSAIARSARYKKGKGGRAVHTKLPCDTMTNAQIKKMNGPVESYQLGKPMGWSVFKAMPDNVQREYLNKLVSKHGGTAVTIAEMFGVPDHIIRNYARTLGVQFPQGMLTNEHRTAWELFIKTPIVPESPSEPESPTKAPAQEYDLNRAYSHKEFKAMPDKTKKAYLERLMSKYGATCSDIATMFGCSDQTVRRVADALKVSKKKGRSKKQAKAWSRFLRLNAEYMANMVPAAAPEAKPVKAPLSPAPAQDEPAAEPVSAVEPVPVQPEPAAAASNVAVQEPILEPVADVSAEPVQEPVAHNPADLVSILSGAMTLTGSANECLAKIAAFLGNTHCTITVQWAVQEDTAQ